MMKPEDIDKLYKERLGSSTPTPPADLWNRLQERMADEMPTTNQEKSKPRGFMYLSYSIAAAIALLLAVGIVFFNVQNGQVPVGSIAQQPAQVAEQPLVDPQQAAREVGPAQGIAQVAVPSENTESVPGMSGEVKAPVEVNSANAASSKPMLAKTQSTTAVKQASTVKSATVSDPATQLVARAELPEVSGAPKKGDDYNTGETVPATFAANTSNMNAQPVEIIIKRAVYEVPQTEEEPELSGFEKKQKLAKNIFKQVRNLSNGEKVELSELGINANSIALETQIGKQKISKVIQL